MNTIEESINFLKERDVTYILSAPWTTPSNTMLPAYEWCVLTRYLGDPRYLPPVYVSSSGTAIYHVGAMEEKEVYASFSQMEDFAPPIKHVRINLTITNETDSPSGKFYIPIPADYREGLMMASVNSSKHFVNVELWKGIIPENLTTNRLEKPELIKEWPDQSADNSGVEDPSFVWQVDRTGYFTFQITDQDTFSGDFNVTVDIRFCNYWDIKSLFIPQGSETYNITASDEMFPLMKVLYIQVNEPSILSINSTTFNKKICLEIFNDLVPNNAVINWSVQYEMVRWQPDFNDSGEMDPSIQNMFLPYGNYSILVIDRGNYTDQNILLEVNFTSLR
jgi:hypothetical protein